MGSVQTDINRFPQKDIDRKETTGTSSGRHRSNPSDRHWQKRKIGFGPDKHQLAPQTDTGRKETLGTSSGRHRLNPSGRHWQKRNIGFSPDRHQLVPSDRHLQKRNIGHQFRQTLIEPHR